MPFKLYTYRRIGDLESALRGLPPSRGRIFIAGGTGDAGQLQRIMSAGPNTSPEYRVFRWGDLYRYFAEKLNVSRPVVQIDPPDHWLLLCGIVKEFREAGGELPPGAARTGFLPALGEQIRELISEDVPPESLERFSSEDAPLGGALAPLYRAYLAALSSNGLCDSAGIAGETRKLLGLPGADRLCRTLDVVLVGFASLTHSQLTLVRSLVGGGASVVCFSPDGGLADSYGTPQQFGEPGESLSSAEPLNAALLEGGDPRQELETAARSLALWEQGEGPLAGEPWPGWDAIAFSIPIERVPEAKEVFSRYGLPCSWNFRTKVSESPLWRLSNACLDAASGDWQTEPVLRLLSEPWLCGFGLNADKLRSKHPRGVDWDVVLSEAAKKSFVACRKYASKVAGGGTPLVLLANLREFAAGCANRVARLAVESPELDGIVDEFSGAVRELDRKILYIRELVRDIGRFGSQRFAGSDARAFLSAWAEGTTIEPPQGESDSMAVFAGTPPTLFHVSRWFMIGCEARNWPGGEKESPILGERQKEMLHSDLGLDRAHLPLLEEKRQQKEFLFRRMIACGDACTFICCSATDASGREQDVTQLAAAAAKDGWIQLNGKKIARTLDGLLASRSEAALTPVEARRPDFSDGNRLPSERLLSGRLDASSNKVYLSSVDDYDSCQYLFALRYLLNYSEPARTDEFDPRKGGDAMHRLWQLVWNAYRNSGFLSSLPELADVHFDEAVEKEYPDLGTNPALRRSLEDLRFQVRRSAQNQQKMEDAGLRDLRAEIRTEDELPPTDTGGVTFSGRCDRLDVLRDGRYILWDYKSGKSSDRNKKKQLACYSLALERGGRFPEGTCAGWGYVCLKDGKVAGAFARDITEKLKGSLPDKGRNIVSFAEAGALSNRSEEAVRLLEDIARSMETREFMPNYKNKSFCPNCAYQGLCRRGELSSEFDDEEGDGDE